MNGNDIIISIDGTPIAAVKSAQIRTKTDTEEISSPATGTWKEYIPSFSEWEFSTSYLVLREEALLNVLNIGTTYDVVANVRDSLAFSYKLTGRAILIEASITATRGTLCSGSFKFKGTGELTHPSLTPVTPPSLGE